MFCAEAEGNLWRGDFVLPNWLKRAGLGLAFVAAGTLLDSMSGDSQVDLVEGVIGLTGRLGGRPSWDEYFMATAFLLASRSACDRLHVGCVIVSGEPEKNRLVAGGYNGFLPGTPHRSRVRDGHEQATVHAEQNAIADAARRGSSVAGCSVYITHFPCVTCAKILAAAGIRSIKYHIDYRNDPIVLEIFGEAGVRVERF